MDAPRDNLIRGYRPGLRFGVAGETRDDEDLGDGRTMFGHFTVFDQFTEIDSYFEGHFLERIAKGAFKKTFAERGAPKVMVDHGRGIVFDNMPLGVPDVLREEDFGPYYEVPLVHSRLVDDELIPRLRAGLMGASFMFNVLREDWNEEPDPSDANPLGLPERTVTEVRLHEFGPVVWPAYEAATAKVRSLTDHFNDRTSPRRAATDEHPAEDDAAPTTGDAAASDEQHLSGLTPAQRAHALRAVLL